MNIRIIYGNVKLFCLLFHVILYPKNKHVCNVIVCDFMFLKRITFRYTCKTFCFTFLIFIMEMIMGFYP